MKGAKRCKHERKFWRRLGNRWRANLCVADDARKINFRMADNPGVGRLCCALRGRSGAGHGCLTLAARDVFRPAGVTGMTASILFKVTHCHPTIRTPATFDTLVRSPDLKSAVSIGNAMSANKSRTRVEHLKNPVAVPAALSNPVPRLRVGPQSLPRAK